jgi:hypothetical protein
MTNDLTRLAEMHGTDKFGGHRYTQHYHKHFKELRDQPVRLLEIGIGGYDKPDQGGASLRMWRDYFPQGNISGLDFYPKPGVASDRIKTYHGSQCSPVTIAQILADTEGGEFDIIIDDGSHRSEDVITSFRMLFQHVAPNGWYIVEDVQTSYWPTFGGSITPTPGAHTSMEFLKGLIDGLNWEEVHRPLYSPNYFDTHVFGIYFYHNLVFIQKGDNREGSNVLKNTLYPGM